MCALRVYMPGAFARRGPQLANAFGATDAGQGLANAFGATDAGQGLANAFGATDAGQGQAIEFAAFRPSGVLAQAILAGEPADLYVSANVIWMRRLQRAGRVQHWSTLARNRLCVVAVPGADVRALADLTRPGLRVVAPQAATDPCGRYVEQL